MKAVLSNRIYMNASPELAKAIDKELTYSIPSYNPMDPPLIIKNVAPIRKGMISIPIGRTDLIPDDYEIIDKRVFVPVEFPEFKFELRESQQKVYDELDDNAIINAWVSWGKTFTGLAIASKLGQKTLIVVHTAALRNQWIKEIKKVFGIEPGIIGGGKFDIDSPIVVGNIQSLYRRIPQIRKEFGTVILDEMHHVSSRTFSGVLDTNYCRYKIGLSGTIERKDGKHVVFRDYFGQKVFKPPKENYMVPKIVVVNTDIPFLDGAKTPWANRVNHLCNQEAYVKLVALLASGYAAKGHKVLIVSDRVQFLKNCAELAGDKAICVTGEVKDREALIDTLEYGEQNQLYGTQAIFAEGISVPPLSCLILATPLNNMPLLTQLIGRVIREMEGKLQPIIVDIKLKGNTARRQASNRLGHYIKEGYEITYL